MATKEQAKTFIEKLAPLAQAEYAKRKAAGQKWVLPSICIAQAALETGWGKSSLMTKANAFFGIKWAKGCGYNAYSSKTKEVYDGNTTTITAAFRAYKNLEASVKDYFDLITGLPYYKDMVNNPDHKSAIYGIDNNGDRNDMDGLAAYATDPNYEQNIISIIERYSLTQYDNNSTIVENKPSASTEREYQYNVGDHVVFSTCYRTSIDDFSKHILAEKMVKNHGVITKIVNAKNPYLLDNGMCWVNDGDIRGFYEEIVVYYPKYIGNSVSIVDALNAIGEDASLENRKKIAKTNGINSYSGTPAQNTKMLNLLKLGKLIQ